MADLQPFMEVAFQLYDAIAGADSEARELQLKRFMIDALKTGVVTGHFADDSGLPLAAVPPWAWVGCEDEEYLWTEGVLPLDPALPDEWWQHSLRAVVVPFDGWRGSLSRSGGSLPNRPNVITRRDPPDEAFVSLSHAVSWLALGYSMDKTHFEWAMRRGRLSGSFDAINVAIARLCDAALCEHVRLDGRQAGGDIVEIHRLALHEAKSFDVLTDGLMGGEGWARNEAGCLIASDLPAFYDVKVDRQQLVEACAPVDLDRARLTASAEHLCSLWLKTEIIKHDPKKIGKDFFLEEAKRLFPGLSGRAFTRIWRSVSKSRGFDRVGRKSKH